VAERSLDAHPTMCAEDVSDERPRRARPAAGRWRSAPRGQLPQLCARVRC